MFIPIPLNLDQGPGRKLLFDSGYDVRLSTYYSPDGVDLSESPDLRSLFQKFIGQENIELQLNKIADDPRVQESMALMQLHLKQGVKDMDPMKSYVHNKMIKVIFDKARKKAWGKMLAMEGVQDLLAEKEARDRRQMQSLTQTSALTLVNK